jgi:16S rRNA (uracil1498-N3)-methyltransferase
MRRFFVPPGSVSADRVTLTGSEAHHLAVVVRLRAGDSVILFDGSAVEYATLLERVTPEAVSGRVIERRAAPVPQPRLTLVQGVPKGTKMDQIIRMGTELGIAEFLPVRTARSVAESPRRVERWRRIAVASAKQSTRADLPVVHVPTPFPTALEMVGAADLLVVLWEGESAHTLGQVLAPRQVPARAALIVGPEGGLESGEVDAAVAAGAVPATLGPLILRTDTAGVAAAAMVFYEFALRRT